MKRLTYSVSLTSQTSASIEMAPTDKARLVITRSKHQPAGLHASSLQAPSSWLHIGLVGSVCTAVLYEPGRGPLRKRDAPSSRGGWDLERNVTRAAYQNRMESLSSSHYANESSSIAPSEPWPSGQLTVLYLSITTPYSRQAQSSLLSTGMTPTSTGFEIMSVFFVLPCDALASPPIGWNDSEKGTQLPE